MGKKQDVIDTQKELIEKQEQIIKAQDKQLDLTSDLITKLIELKRFGPQEERAAMSMLAQRKLLKTIL